ncbi:MAG TPA: IspD/TarI family cytidylyltransferase, partial [Ktedonobacteraceae bacterium]|nr:IspD/TarI family cytidylyltransferase [Ktedonobacteraceae bacterium]
MVVSAIIAAAGTSRRMEGRDKLWTPLAGRLTLARTVNVFEASPLIESIVLVVNEERLADAAALRGQEGWGKITAIVAGGARRQDSVRAGLTSLAEAAPATQWVMIHDGARPLVTPALIEAGLLAAQQHHAAIAAVPVKDTIKQGVMGFVQATIDRANLWAVQTPQVFSFALISQAYALIELPDDVTDDAALLERQGHRV